MLGARRRFIIALLATVPLASVHACGNAGGTDPAAAGAAGTGGGSTGGAQGAGAGAGASGAAGSGIGVGVGGGNGAGCGCTDDLKAIAGCNGAPATPCPSGQACLLGACVADACGAADAAKSTYGCDFWALQTDLVSNPLIPPGPGVCFAAFVANTWTDPVHITVDAVGKTFPVASFARIPHGKWAAITSANTPFLPGARTTTRLVSGERRHRAAEPELSARATSHVEYAPAFQRTRCA